MSQLEWVKIVILQGNAGQVTLLGQSNDRHWFFKKEEDALLRIEHPTITNNFHDGLNLLGHSWPYLTPLYIHPAFKTLLWQEVKLLQPLSLLTSWRKACM